MNDDELISRRKKQNADRVRAYRKRKKDLDAMPSTSTVQSGETGQSWQQIVVNYYPTAPRYDSELLLVVRNVIKTHKLTAHIGLAGHVSTAVQVKKKNIYRERITLFTNGTVFCKQSKLHRLFMRVEAYSVSIFIASVKSHALIAFFVWSRRQVTKNHQRAPTARGYGPGSSFKRGRA
ncbi:hypothetical protein EVAR_64260_1 [Eumeta japonica]|uniref:Uncharacterized protein n=1 Tax=Eumeta variegata TaxID=151549 RepID=A0A4C1YTV6_EUMVA|nr:hypothetical protein EVAR_64260_1 [Eumeta japonica]